MLCVVIYGNVGYCALFYLGENMKCGDCNKFEWFGDYALHYCGITKKIVHCDSECHINSKEETKDDYLSQKNFSKKQKDSSRL